MATVNPQTDKQAFQASLIYDPANSVQGANSDTSVLVNAPKLLSFNNMNTGTDISVQVKVHKNDTFKQITNVLGSGGATQIYEFTNRWNYVQLVRTGTQNAVVYAQS